MLLGNSSRIYSLSVSRNQALYVHIQSIIGNGVINIIDKENDNNNTINTGDNNSIENIMLRSKIIKYVPYHKDNDEMIQVQILV